MYKIWNLNYNYFYFILLEGIKVFNIFSTQFKVKFEISKICMKYKSSSWNAACVVNVLYQW